MQRDLILGTAGHIDHGKTSLVRALTGIDCDRLPEEKKRGITIDIGFANFTLGEFRLGIVDVPGHERFIKNMLAGATGIDLAVLVISAGESIKPQTREHLEILQLLGIRHGVIALTKCDLVDETTLQLLEMEIRDFVKGTFLEKSAIVPNSAQTGQGIEDLRTALAAECAKVSARQTGDWFRMAIDRAFVVQGHGTVVTGSVTSGAIQVDSEVDWLPSGRRLRIRGLNHHNQPVSEVERGQRAAINLAGVSLDEVVRGQELATPGYLIASRVLTVKLFVPSQSAKSLKHRLPARLHIGTAEVMCTLSLLDCDVLNPGEAGFAQLFLEDEVTAVWGQPFILRDSSAEHTIAGGQVLQPTTTKIRRRHLEILERIEKLASDQPLVRAEMAAWFAGYHGFSAADWVRGAGLHPNEIDAMQKQLLDGGVLRDVPTSGQHRVVLHRDRLHDLEQRILDLLQRLHTENVLMTSHDRQKVLAQLDYIGDDGILQGAVDHLIRDKRLVGDSQRIARSDFKPKLSANQRKLKDRVVAAHLSAGFQPPEPDSFAAQAGGNASALQDIYAVAVAEGLLVKITEEIYLHAEVEIKMKALIRQRLETVAGLTVADIRDLLGTTRKFAVPLCEYLDRAGATARQGDLRVRAHPQE